jgi:hypothetical protein
MSEPSSKPIDNPYVGPRTFVEAEAHLFFGREREARDLTARIVSERLLLFYAQSGAGKSSLINTRVIPWLRDEEGFQVLPIGRVSGELPPDAAHGANSYTFNLMSSLDQGGADARLLAQVSLSDFLARLEGETVGEVDGRRSQRWVYRPDSAIDRSAAAAQPAPGSPRFALVIDQFEEIITAHPERWEERDEFFHQLNQALLDDPALWVVLSLREDYVASLDPYTPRLFNRLRARFYMERMGVGSALEAIQLPAERCGRPFAAGVAATLVDDLRQMRLFGQQDTVPGPYIEPLQLQVVCHRLWERLWEESIEANAAQVNFDGSAAIGDVDQALTQFYEETLAAALADPTAQGVSERHIRTWFEEKLITEAGTRGLVRQDSEDTGGLPNGVVRSLQKRLLVRSEPRGADSWIELVHDRLVEPIRSSNREWFPAQLSPLQRQAALWDEQERSPGLLLRDASLVDAERWAAAHDSELEAHEQAFLDACREKKRQEERDRKQNRRIRVLAVVAVTVALVAIGAAFLAITGQQQARSASALAQAEAARARNAEATAVAEQQRAESQTRYAQAGELAAYAENTIVNNKFSPDLALLLARQAVEITRSKDKIITPHAERALRHAVFAAPPYRKTLGDRQHSGVVWSAAFSPNGQQILSGGGDSVVRIWDVNSGAEVRQLPGHADAVYSAAFSPDGKTIVSGSDDRTARIWDASIWVASIWVASIDDLLAEAARLIQRDPPRWTLEERQKYGLE